MQRVDSQIRTATAVLGFLLFATTPSWGQAQCAVCASPIACANADDGGLCLIRCNADFCNCANVETNCGQFAILSPPGRSQVLVASLFAVESPVADAVLGAGGGVRVLRAGRKIAGPEDVLSAMAARIGIRTEEFALVETIVAMGGELPAYAVEVAGAEGYALSSRPLGNGAVVTMQKIVAGLPAGAAAETNIGPQELLLARLDLRGRAHLMAITVAVSGDTTEGLHGLQTEAVRQAKTFGGRRIRY